MRPSRAAVFLALCLVAASCGGCGAVESRSPERATIVGEGTAKEANRMVLTSTDFTYGSPMPGSTAHSAANRSPALAWSLAPGGTKSFAIVCVDLSPAANGWVHWLAVDVPAAATSLASGASGSGMPAGTRELRNTYGSRGWGGPEPPFGTGRHEYEFTVYALDVYALDVLETADLRAVQSEMEGHVLDSATLVGTFER